MSDPSSLSRQLSRLSKPTWAVAPVAGMLLVGVLYVQAAALYPGGSQADPTARGFGWRHNYWCTLLPAQALNGVPTPARPVALLVKGPLCLSLAASWHQVPVLLPQNRAARLIRLPGMPSMGAASFLFTPCHDLSLNVAGGL